MIYQNTQLFINGNWQDGIEGKSLSVLNPATGKEIGRVAAAGKLDIELAAAAAKDGFDHWRRLTPIVRAQIMRNAAELLRERTDDVAQLMTQEQGKPLNEARGEVRAAADIIDWFADEGLRIYGRLVPSRVDPSIRQMVVKDPVGPVAAFTPWNFPINQIVRKVGAALAAGCSIVVKGPEETPASPAALIQAFHDAGMPPGVLGLVYGNPSEISELLITHPAIRKITFTGSTSVGKQLAGLAGLNMKRATMELGGHAPFIVAADADLDQAVRVAVSTKFRNAGQVCVSPSRFLVHSSLFQAFVDSFSQHAESLKVGDGMATGTQMGPLMHSRRLAAMGEFIEDAIEEGATLVTGGSQIGDAGYFWQPTVLADIPTTAMAFNNEPFGPIAAVRRFDAIEDAITEANRLSYGLAGYGFTQSLRTAELLAREVEVGMMWINMPTTTSAEMPFGGIKDSGYGSEGGPEAIEAYLNVRSIAMLST